ARLRDCTGLDRLNDLLVLLLEDIELNAALGQICALPDRSARNDEAAEVLQEARELRIPGGSGNRTMECKILIHRAVAAVDRCLNGIESVADLFDVCRGSTLGRQSRCFDLVPGAECHGVEHLAEWRVLVEVDAKWPPHVIGDKGAHSLAGDH